MGAALWLLRTVSPALMRLEYQGTVGGGLYDALAGQKARKRETCSSAFICVESTHS